MFLCVPKWSPAAHCVLQGATLQMYQEPDYGQFIHIVEQQQKKQRPIYIVKVSSEPCIAKSEQPSETRVRQCPVEGISQQPSKHQATSYMGNCV